MIYCVVGRQRQGKTTLGKFLADQSPTRVLYDPREQFHTTDVFYFGGEEPSLYELLDEKPEIIVRPGMEMDSLVDSTCSVILDWRRDNPGEKIALLVDEANLVEMNSKPREKFPHLNYMLRSAGEDDLNLIFTAHRITDLHPDIRAIAHYFCLFRITHSGDLRAVQEKCDDDVTDRVKELDPQHLLIWNDNIGEFRLHPDRTKWYVPLRKNIPVRESEGLTV